MKSDTSPLVFCTLLYRMRGPMNRLLIGQDTVVDKRISTLEEDGYLRYSDVSIMGVTGCTPITHHLPTSCHKQCPSTLAAICLY
ncbi:uncharacterized protein TNIN_415381 [Trichonephila inaurata madagascariensis]|uniref:Uncharacterized protein n=1 Tax=Trichonephila inaurata madagascariensis TaxID=2747483 RepID=A0A8X6Y8C5_9ARAC|nr:uncharacterized protein TNIN_415381 [Trichonephila inaurata madagascariensis]